MRSQFASKRDRVRSTARTDEIAFRTFAPHTDIPTGASGPVAPGVSFGSLLEWNDQPL